MEKFQSIEGDSFLSKFVKKIRLQKFITTIFLLIIIVIIPLIVIIKENYKVENLELEMNNYFFLLYFLSPFLIILIIIAPIVLIIYRNSNKYLNFLHTLSQNDINKFEKMNENLSFLEIPFFIVKEKKMTIFKSLKQETINFEEINMIEVKRMLMPKFGLIYFLRISDRVKAHTYRLLVSKVQIENFIKEAKEANSKINFYHG